MRDFFSSDMPGLHVLAELEKEIATKKDQLTNIKFSTPEGQFEAVDIQSQIKAIKRVQDMLVSLCNEEEEMTDE